jgi:hypothetical protein
MPERPLRIERIWVEQVDRSQFLVDFGLLREILKRRVKPFGIFEKGGQRQPVKLLIEMKKTERKRSGHSQEERPSRPLSMQLEDNHPDIHESRREVIFFAAPPG